MSRRWAILVAGLVIALLIATALGARPSGPDTASSRATASDSTGPSAGASGSGPIQSAPRATPASSAGAAPPTSGTVESLAGLLALLPIAPERRAGYERSLFVLWIDADGDGCDTRHEVLIRDARIKPHVGTRCLLTGGSWFSLYDATTFADPAKLQIDHVIPLAEAWDSGAFAWSPQEREAFANDLGVPFALLAVSAATNESKSDDDPADWLPPSAGARCPYLGDWLATKARWDLAVDQREHDAIAADIGTCSTTMPYVPATWPAGPSATTLPLLTLPPAGGSGGSRAGCDPAYPTVCIAPPPPDLDCGDIPYRNFEVLPPDPHRFDGDHDGIGCET